METTYTALVRRRTGHARIERHLYIRGTDVKVRARTYDSGHPSFPGGLPAIVAPRRPATVCTDCESLEHAATASETLGDADGVTAYTRQLVRHVQIRHGGAA